MKVLVACEFSGVVRDAFTSRGHDAWSCDLEPSERPGQHIQGDVLEVLKVPGEQWDLMIAHPPCTYLAASGARWWVHRRQEQQGALAFVRALLAAPVLRIALENPVGRIGTAVRKPDQSIHPWQYGHEEEKWTCVWLKNLPRLQPTCCMDTRYQRCWRMSPSPVRSRDRSRTYAGIAQAMALQWT